MIVFLDIDGVLHPRVGGGGFLPGCVTALADALRPFDVQIVVSSSWRLTCHLDELRELLGGVGKPVIGKTAELSRDREHKRYREILAYLEEFGADVKWVAIDDTNHFFPIGAPVFATDPKYGFTAQDTEGLRRLIRSEMAPNREKSYKMSIAPDEVFDRVECERESGQLAENVTTAEVVYFASKSRPNLIERVDRATGKRSIGKWAGGTFVPVNDDS